MKRIALGTKSTRSSSGSASVTRDVPLAALDRIVGGHGGGHTGVHISREQSTSRSWNGGGHLQQSQHFSFHSGADTPEAPPPAPSPFGAHADTPPDVEVPTADSGGFGGGSDGSAPIDASPFGEGHPADVDASPFGGGHAAEGFHGDAPARADDTALLHHDTAEPAHAEAAPAALAAPAAPAAPEILHDPSFDVPPPYTPPVIEDRTFYPTLIPSYTDASGHDVYNQSPYEFAPGSAEQQFLQNYSVVGPDYSAPFFKL